MVGSLTFSTRFTVSFGFFDFWNPSGGSSFVSPGALPGQSLTGSGSAARAESASVNARARERPVRDMGQLRGELWSGHSVTGSLHSGHGVTGPHAATNLRPRRHHYTYGTEVRACGGWCWR